MALVRTTKMQPGSLRLYSIEICDPDKGFPVHVISHGVLAKSKWEAVRAIIEHYGFTRAWPLRAQEIQATA